MAFTYTAAKYYVVGNLRKNIYAGCAASSGDTLVIGMNAVKQVNCDPVSTTNNVTYTVANSTPIPGQCTLTFTPAAPFTGLNISVEGT